MGSSTEPSIYAIATRRHTEDYKYNTGRKMIASIRFLVLVLVLVVRNATAFFPVSSFSGHATPNVATNTERSHDIASTQLEMVGRLFRRAREKRRGVQTLDREKKKSKKKEEPEPMWRVMLHNTEYQPEIVARIVAKTTPALDRRAAYELCTYARFAGKVTLVITPKKQAELYCLGLQRKGLPSTIEPHDVER